MKLKKPYVFLIFSMLICFGCKKDCTEYKLGILSQYNPLYGNDTVMFIDSSENKYSFKGEGRSISIYSSDYNGECYREEIDDCFYRDSEDKYHIQIGLRPTSFHVPAFLFIVLSDYNYNESWHFRSIVNFNIPLDKNNLDDNQFYFDSLLVNNTTQYDVFAGIPDLSTIPTTKQTLLDTVHPSMFYYNKQNGLIKVDFDDGSTWELIVIK